MLGLIVSLFLIIKKKVGTGAFFISSGIVTGLMDYVR